MIRQLASSAQLPWCIYGDFNDLLSQSDKEGIHDHPQYLLTGFREAIVDSGLMELDLYGGRFTWEEGKGTSNWIRERLDRAFASNSWWQLFPLCKLSVYHTIYSDHDPMQLDLCNVALSKKNFRFEFENTWLREESFHGEVSQYWDNLPRMQLLPKLLAISSYLAKWGRNFFHKFKDKLSKQRKVVLLLASKSDEDSIKRYFVERNKLDELLLHEESYWKQRAKMFWLADGDANSKFFHAYASSRRKTNNISKLYTNDGGIAVTDTNKHKVVLKYFRKVFGDQGSNAVIKKGSVENMVT